MTMRLPRLLRRLVCVVLGHEPWWTTGGYRSLQCARCGELVFLPPG